MIEWTNKKGLVLTAIFLAVVSIFAVYWLKTNASRLEFTEAKITAINYFGTPINELDHGFNKRKIKFADLTDDVSKGVYKFLRNIREAQVHDISEVVAITPDSSYLVINSRKKYAALRGDETQPRSFGFYEYKTILYDKNLQKLWETPYMGADRWGRTMISEDGHRVLISNDRVADGGRRWQIQDEKGPYLVVINREGETIFNSVFDQIEGAALSPSGRYLAYLESNKITEPLTVFDLDEEEKKGLKTGAEEFDDHCRLAAKNLRWDQHEGNPGVLMGIFCEKGGIITWWVELTEKLN